MDQLAQWEGPSISTPPSAPRVGKKGLSSHDQQWTRRQGKPPHVRTVRVVVVDDWPGTSQILKTADKTWFTRATWVRGQCLAEWAVHPGLLGSHRLSWKRSDQFSGILYSIYIYMASIYIYIIYIYYIYIYFIYIYIIYISIILYIWRYIYIYGYTVVIYSGSLLLLVAWDSLSPLQQYRLYLSSNSFRLVFKDTFAANNIS